jgi:hypothetical protein
MVPSSVWRMKMKKVYEVLVNKMVTVWVEVEAEDPSKIRLDWDEFEDCFLDEEEDIEIIEVIEAETGEVVIS